MHAFFALVTGLVFGLGLILSGMTDPSKVLGFLDLAGGWDPSLAFVMGGAVPAALFAFHFAKGRSTCPAPASLLNGGKPLILVGAMVAGMALYDIEDRLAARGAQVKREPV